MCQRGRSGPACPWSGTRPRPRRRLTTPKLRPCSSRASLCLCVAPSGDARPSIIDLPANVPLPCSQAVIQGCEHSVDGHIRPCRPRQGLPRRGVACLFFPGRRGIASRRAGADPWPGQTGRPGQAAGPAKPRFVCRTAAQFTLGRAPGRTGATGPGRPHPLARPPCQEERRFDSARQSFFSIGIHIPVRATPSLYGERRRSIGSADSWLPTFWGRSCVRPMWAQVGTQVRRWEVRWCLPPSGAKRGRGSETMARGSDGIARHLHCKCCLPPSQPLIPLCLPQNDKSSSDRSCRETAVAIPRSHRRFDRVEAAGSNGPSLLTTIRHARRWRSHLSRQDLSATLGTVTRGLMCHHSVFRPTGATARESGLHPENVPAGHPHFPYSSGQLCR
jgi:hypothetical protein